MASLTQPGYWQTNIGSLLIIERQKQHEKLHLKREQRFNTILLTQCLYCYYFLLLLLCVFSLLLALFKTNTRSCTNTHTTAFTYTNFS